MTPSTTWAGSSRRLLVGSVILAINFAVVPDKGTLVISLVIIAVAAIIGFVIRERRAPEPLYDLTVASRRIFWVAACAGIIVFGSLMGAMFIGQQFLQNVLGYSTIDAGLAILPAAVFMVLIAPRSAKLVEAKGARFTLLVGDACIFLGFLTMLLLWKDGSAYWEVGLAYAFVGAGVGFAGTPASHSLTGSVPVTRVGMASGRRICSATLEAPSCSRSWAPSSRPGTPPRPRRRSSSSPQLEPGEPRTCRAS